MSKNKQSILLIANDGEMAKAVSGALSELSGVALTTEDSSVSRLNGSAIKMASEHDMVLFATDPSDAADLTAIEALAEKRAEGSVFIALTDSDIPLSRANALNRAGVDDVLPYPMPDEELRYFVERWAEKLKSKSASAANEGRLICVAQARGGIGATTLAVNLADQLQGKAGRFKKGAKHNVAIVDLDFQFGTVADLLDTEPQEALMTLALDGIVPDGRWIDDATVESSTGLTVLAAPGKFAPLDALTPQQVAAVIDGLRATHDYVVVDLPRALVNWIEPVIASADQMIVVTDTTVPSVRATRRLIDFYKADNPNLAIEIVINHEKKPMMRANHHKEAARLLETKFNHWLPSDSKSARQASDFGKPLSEVSTRSDLFKGISALAKATQTAFPVRQHATR